MWDRCAALALLVLPACTADEAFWTDVALDDALDATFRVVTGEGEQAWAFGALEGDMDRELVEGFDGERWRRVDTYMFSNRAWVSSDGEVWAIDVWREQLARGDGRNYRVIDLEPALGVADYHVTEVWGSSSSDVFALVQLAPFPSRNVLVHYDGEAWAIDDSWRSLFTFDEESGAALQLGCSTSATDIWLAGFSSFGLGTGAELLHGDGTTWERRPVAAFAGEGETVTALACRDGRAWAASNVFDGGRVVYSTDDGWAEVVLPTGGGRAVPVALAAGDGDAWLVGSEVVDDVRTPQIWHLTEAGAELTLTDDLGLARGANDPSPLTSAWVSSSGRVFVVGVDGMILEH